MALPTLDRCTLLFLVYSDIFIIGFTLKASMIPSGFTCGSSTLWAVVKVVPMSQTISI
uniref:Uncharacterized protein n=1 Tax=Lepeophtheirus salmonis TaxID=72036 RepID=A0A0K2VDE3_LEPSM